MRTLFAALLLGTTTLGQAPAQTPSKGVPAQGPPPKNLTQRADGHFSANPDTPGDSDHGSGAAPPRAATTGARAACASTGAGPPGRGRSATGEGSSPGACGPCGHTSACCRNRLCAGPAKTCTGSQTRRSLLFRFCAQGAHSAEPQGSFEVQCDGKRAGERRGLRLSQSGL